MSPNTLEMLTIRASSLCGRHARRKRGDRGGVRNVEMVPADLHLVADDCRCGALQAVIVDVGERQMAAAPCERKGDRSADPRSCPCHDGGAALQFQ